MCDDPPPPALRCTLVLGHTISCVAQHWHRGREIVSADVASAIYDDAAASCPAGSSSWTPREKGLRVLAGSGENTLSSSGESSTSGDTQSARARGLRSKSCGTARIAIIGKLNTPHSPQLAPPPARRPETQSITSVLPRLSIFICPLRNLTPTPKSAFRGGD